MENAKKQTNVCNPGEGKCGPGKCKCSQGECKCKSNGANSNKGGCCK